MTTSEKSDKRGEWLSGLVFWVVIAVVAAIFWLRSDKAQIFFDVSRTQTLVVQGVVHFKGKPVSDGTVHIVVHGAKSRRYLGGVVVPVDKQGRFSGLRGQFFTL